MTRQQRRNMERERRKQTEQLRRENPDGCRAAHQWAAQVDKQRAALGITRSYMGCAFDLSHLDAGAPDRMRAQLWDEPPVLGALDLAQQTGARFVLFCLPVDGLFGRTFASVAHGWGDADSAYNTLNKLASHEGAQGVVWDFTGLDASPEAEAFLQRVTVDAAETWPTRGTA